MNYPEVGIVYNAFDDGHLVISKWYRIRVVSITTLDKVEPQIRKQLIEEQEEGDFYIKDSQDVVIGIQDSDQEDETFWFLPTKNHGWQGMNISAQIMPVLDITGELYDELVERTFGNAFQESYEE